ncbi:1-acyl-sn-glycerol-3-phosphate acyltransferase [Gemmatimonadota bacterium]
MVLRWILSRWVRAALWIRFRQIRIVYHAPVPLDGAAILAGNHQNAILDSLTLASCSPKTPYTLSRAALFNNRLAGAFLKSLHMLPIYRFRDGFGKMRRNTEIFQQFVEVLRSDGWLLMFPEGSHYLRYTLRPFQKGIARIALAAQDAQSWEKEIPILPVGLQYESHTTFGSRLLIQFGPPVSTLAFKALHSRNPREAEGALTEKVFDELRRLLILPPPEEERYESAVQRWNLNRARFRDLMEQFRADQEVLAGEVDPPARPGPGKNGLRKLAGYALSFPGVILHLPVILVTLALEKAFVPDIHLGPAARFAAGMFLVPLWWVGAIGVLFSQVGFFPWALGALALMPLSLWLWSRCWHWTR